MGQGAGVLFNGQGFAFVFWNHQREQTVLSKVLRELQSWKKNILMIDLIE